MALHMLQSKYLLSDTSEVSVYCIINGFGLQSSLLTDLTLLDSALWLHSWVSVWTRCGLQVSAPGRLSHICLKSQLTASRGPISQPKVIFGWKHFPT